MNLIITINTYVLNTVYKCFTMQYCAHISLAAAKDFEWIKQRERNQKKNCLFCGRKRMGYVFSM